MFYCSHAACVSKVSMINDVQDLLLSVKMHTGFACKYLSKYGISVITDCLTNPNGITGYYHHCVYNVTEHYFKNFS